MAGGSIRRVGSTSSRNNILGSSWQPIGARKIPTVKKLKLSNRKAQDEYRSARSKEHEAREAELLPEQLNTLEVLRDFDDGEDTMESRDEEIRLEDVLDGRTEMDISHGGGELTDALRREVEEEYRQKHPKRMDFRTRRDRVQRRVEGFQKQMNNMVETYIEWVGEGEAPPCREGVAGGYLICVVDLLENYNLEADLNAGGKGVAAALIKQGLFPCAPYDPSVVITARALEFFRVAHARCPRLAIQTFIKSICDLHGEPYRPYLCQQFSISFDLYLEIRRKTRNQVLQTLGRLGKEWRLKHVCPCCTYHLVDDPEMTFSMLATFDGNESLRRVARKVMNPDGSVDLEDDTGEPLPPKSKERTDTRDAGEGYFIDREAVDKWAKKKLANLLPTDKSPGESVPCADRWKNMINDITSKMWGIFDETGIFLALCRHGFVLLLVDMIRSGKLDELLDAYGKKLGLGYDVGCHLEETIKNSDLSEKAKEYLLKMLVGAFHGHAHNRLCQLKFLATYIHGLGLEDLEGCERFFSKSNEMAKVVRYSSRFHCQQEITGFIKHFDDFETYANLSKFLCKNYEQALALLATEASLKLLMRREGIESVDEFDRWLVEEREWLESKKEQGAKQVVTMEMDYVQKLVNLRRNEIESSQNAAEERGLQHARAVRDRDMDAVMELEDRLGVKDRWTTTAPEWIAAVKAVKHKKFMEALNALEVLIVQRIFELTKVNQLETGYKMRKHIAKALQTRSEVVKNAIDRYNLAALAMDPPSPTLTWSEVVEYVFLADFEFLRATDGELNEKPWTRPACRLAMTMYFKIVRAREEIVRLNVEIRRLVTWISDEDEFLRGKEAEAREFGRTHMAVLIRTYRLERARSDMGHMKHIWSLAKMPGFTGCIYPGVLKEKRERIQQERRDRRRERARGDASEMDVDEEEEPVTVDMAAGWQGDPGLEEGWVNVEESAVNEGIEEDIEGQQQEVSEVMYELVRMSVDGRTVEGDIDGNQEEPSVM
ncbi:hypothetical protein B0H16DRAFT_1779478 [Mycena metata]|uniref:CxC1-like cysteine cluster associated with KDZ transposases domain-containing protein n=1 Tax=Mycena metata TaxID=1033252 RepID=A0AAD7MRA0_9AGAR|nr:hypothetical protein B0H16DRAFT_1779478 [Mycena metata]